MKPYNELQQGAIVSVKIGKRTIKARIIDIPKYDPIYIYEPNTSVVTISPINTLGLFLNVDSGICKILKN